MAYATVAGLIAVCGAAYATLPAWLAHHGTDSRILEAVFYKRGELLGMQEPRQRTSGVEMRLGILLRDAANDWRSLLQDPRQQVPFRCVKVCESNREFGQACCDGLDYPI